MRQLSWLAADWFFLEPRGSLSIVPAKPRDIVGSVAFLVIGALLLSLAEAMYRVRRRALLNAVPAEIALLSSAGRVLAVNAAWQRRQADGESRDEMAGPGQSYLDACADLEVDEAGLPVNAAERIRAVLAGELFRWEATYRVHAPRAERWVDMTVALVDENTARCRAIVMRVDVTVRMLLEQNLAETNRRFAETLDSVSDLFAAFDTEWRYTILNEKAAAITGYQQHQLLGRNIWECFPDAVGGEFHREVTAAVASRTARTYETFYAQVDRWFEHRIYPSANGVTVLTTDVTHRRVAEKMFEELLESAPDSMVIVNGQGRIVLVNAQTEKLFGYPRDELLGQLVEILVPDRFRERHLDHRNHYFGNPQARGMAQGKTLYGRRRDGSEFPVEISLSPLTTEKGLLISAAIRDLGDRLALEEQLRQAQKMEAVGHLAGGIAHDFNNILTAITGFTELLREANGGQGTSAEQLAGIASSVERASTLVHQLLAFGRKQVLRPRVIDINETLMALEPMLRRFIGEQILVVTSAQTDLWPVRADSSQLEQVIVNLVLNARDAMPRGGSLTLETSNVCLDDAYCARQVELEPGEYVLLAIADTGTGMDERTQARMFEPFFTTKPTGEGTGLGLPTVYGIVKQSGGHIAVDSLLARGTTIRVYLPRSGEPAIPVQPALPSPVGLGGRETVLFVEDDDLLRDLAQINLGKFGYTVLTALHGEEAMETIRAQGDTIDVLVTDVVMPGMGGMRLAREALGLQPQLKVVLMSGYSDRVVAEQGELMRNLIFLSKPYSPEELLAAIRNSLDGRSSALASNA
ncbi:MAG: PAS domain S-box protein [Pirellulales bacterium]